MAEYDSGEIVIDPKELLEAHWYRYDDLTLLPPPGPVASRLIDDTVAMCRAEYELSLIHIEMCIRDSVLSAIRNISTPCNNLKKQDLVAILHEMLRPLRTRDDLLINRQCRARLLLVELLQ